jgi:molybdopterin synthase sulfur carrier subunit
MNIQVMAFAQFRELIGSDIRADWEEGTSLGTLLTNLGARSDEARHALFDEKGVVRNHVILMVNGMRIDAEDADGTILGDGDTIAVFPPVAGG